eukprot:1194718-Prorocentrum_minimum.AAC.15
MDGMLRAPDMVCVHAWGWVWVRCNLQMRAGHLLPALRHHSFHRTLFYLPVHSTCSNPLHGPCTQTRISGRLEKRTDAAIVPAPKLVGRSDSFCWSIYSPEDACNLDLDSLFVDVVGAGADTHQPLQVPAVFVLHIVQQLEWRPLIVPTQANPASAPFHGCGTITAAEGQRDEPAGVVTVTAAEGQRDEPAGVVTVTAAEGQREKPAGVVTVTAAEGQRDEPDGVVSARLRVVTD